MEQGDGQASMAPSDWDLDWPLPEDGQDFWTPSGGAAPISLVAQFLPWDDDVSGTTTQQAPFVPPTNSVDTLNEVDGLLVLDQYHVPSWTLSPGQAPGDLGGLWNQAQWPLALQTPWSPALPDYSCAMADSFPVSSKEPDQGGSQITSPVPSSFTTPVPEVIHIRAKPANVFTQKLLPAEPGHPSSSQMKGPEPFESRKRYTDLPSTARTRKTASRPYHRLPCTHPGCLLTFPRPYELDRHLTYFHQRQTRIFCSFFECDRNSNPIYRVDKFFEHIKKAHTAADSFLCIVESCRQGPLSRDELVQHLNVQHPLGTLDQPYLEESLNALNLGGTTRVGHKIIVDITSCPLSFLGCDFLTLPRKSGMAKMLEHVQRHDLLERSKGYRAIVQIFGNWEHRGVAKCPICKKVICKRRDNVDDFIFHLVNRHDKETRRMHAIELGQSLWPFLMGKEQLRYDWNQYGHNLFAEFQEAAVFQSLTLESHQDPITSLLNSTSVDI